MSLSQETLELVLRGLGEKPLADGEVIWSRTHSWPTLAAACKAKLRERGDTYQNGKPYFTYNAGYCMGSCDADISTHDDAGRLDVFRGRANTDDEALIEAFALAVKGGAL